MGNRERNIKTLRSLKSISNRRDYEKIELIKWLTNLVEFSMLKCLFSFM